MRKSLQRVSNALSRRLSGSTRGPSMRVQSVVRGSRGLQPMGGECAMCGDLLGTEVCKTMCGHRFCRSCIERQLRASDGTCKCVTCSRPLSYYNVVWADLNEPVKDKDVDSIFGTAFIQFGQVGLESMHFERNQCYLAYDPRVIPRKWTLEDGSRLPTKKLFEPGWTFDPRSRQFRGTIDWSPKSFRGVQKLEYSLVFDEGYELIVDGEVRHFGPEGYFRTRKFGGDKLKNLHYRRAKQTIFGNSYVRVPSPEESDMAEKIVKSLGSLGSWGLGIDPKAVETMLWNELPLMHFGTFSLHFCKNRSYLDVSSLDGYHPARFYFENFKFYPETRTFKGELYGEPDWELLAGKSLWILHFDETLDRVVWGKIKYLDERGKVVKEELCGWDDSQSQRYLLVAPWQKLDDPESKNRFGALEELL